MSMEKEDAQQAESGRITFPFPDLRGVCVAGGVVVAIVLIFAASAGVRLSGRILPPMAILLGLFCCAWSYAGMKALVICPTYIRGFGDTIVMGNKIRRAAFSKRAVTIFYDGKNGVEHQEIVVFGNIRDSARDEAKSALRAWLQGHGVAIEEK